MTDSTLVGTAPNSELGGSAAGTLDGTAVTQYLQFVDNRASRDAGIAHEYTADGLRQLAAALNEVSANATSDVAVQPRIDEIRERADAMQNNPTATEHSLQAREAFSLAANLIGQLHGTTDNASRGNTGNPAYSGTTGSNAAVGDQGALQQAAMAIQPSRALLDQRQQVEQFFSHAADALRTMTNQTR